MNADIDDPGTKLSPRQARDIFLKSKQGDVKKSTVRAYEFPTRHFVEYCEDNGVGPISEVGGHVIESWKAKRREEVKQITLHNNVKHLRVFIRWCETAELLEYGTADRMSVPMVTHDQATSSDVLGAERAEPILDYLETYEYGTRRHALFLTMWHTGCRISGAISLDLKDFESRPGDTHVLTFRNRKALGTPLKNKKGAERNVSLTSDVATVLRDYINGQRDPVTDDFDRDPLFTTQHGRVTRQRAYKDFTALTRPCAINQPCPHDRNLSECTAANFKKKAFGCPSSESLHPIRRGSITHHINQGWPKEKLSERVDVSVEVLSKHYDARTTEKAREGREEYLNLM